MSHPNDWIRQAAAWEAAGRPFALVTVLRAEAPTSAKPGDKALVDADGQIHGWIGGGCAQPAVVTTVRRALADGQPRTIRIAPADESRERSLANVLEFGMACHSGGTLELFVDPVAPPAQLVVVGDSPVARALAGLAPRVGLQVAVVAHGATAADFPDAARVLGDDQPAAVTAALAAGALVVVATQGRRDIPGLRAALALRPRHCWFVASARKADVLKANLMTAGEEAAAVAAIQAPAGQAIGARTPEEVALSVLAAVVAARRGGEPQAEAAAPAAASAAALEPVRTTAPAKASCCGGAAAELPPVAAPVRSSCCGG